MSKGNGKDKFDFSKGITIVISPHSESSFACGIDKSYGDDFSEIKFNIGKFHRNFSL